tara:strand:+ start:152 stop:949 length:798 start_codon:yes stop_codon:yes gene_type:complete
MSKDLEEYEKEYLERLEQTKKEKDKDWAIKKREELEKEEKEVKKLLENLDNTDYTLLEAQKRENLLLTLHIGLEEQLNSSEKLFRCKLIKKLDREPTFSEKEKLERQRDTPQYKQYAARIQRIMDKKMAERLVDFCQKIGLKTPDDPFELTEKGKEILESKRNELQSYWLEIQSSYDKNDKQQFSKKIESNRGMFPLFLIMGLVNGSMMGMMMAKMDMNMNMYMQNMQMMENEQGYADGGDFGEGDFGDSGDGGGFMDGGFQPGF